MAAAAVATESVTAAEITKDLTEIDTNNFTLSYWDSNFTWLINDNFSITISGSNYKRFISSKIKPYKFSYDLKWWYVFKNLDDLKNKCKNKSRKKLDEDKKEKKLKKCINNSINNIKAFHVWKHYKINWKSNSLLF